MILVRSGDSFVARRAWLRLALFIVAIAVLFAYVIRNPLVLSSALSFGWVNLAVLAASYVLFQVLNAYVLRIGLDPPYRGIDIFGALAINFSSSLAGYLTPLRLGGVGSRVLLLRNQFGVLPGHSIGQFMLVTLLTIAISAAFFSVTILLGGQRSYDNYRLAAHILGLFAAFMLAIWFLLENKRIYLLLRPKLPRVLVNAHEVLAIRTVVQSAKVLAALIGVFLLQVLQTQWLLLSVGLSGDWSFSLLVCAAANLMLVFSVTPGNLGVKELLLGTLAATFSIEQHAFVGALLVDRFVQIVVIVVGTLLFANRLNSSPE
jgi:uncharacterized membrane protein YbhN (UPF0104 family)